MEGGNGGEELLSDPIVALATPPGRSALALIRLSGAGAFDVAARCLEPFHPSPPRTVFRARLLDPTTRAHLDDCLAVCFPAPHSYTGDDLVEITTHGGLIVPASAVAALSAAGARPAAPGEFTRRAVLNGKMDLVQAEATADLIDASSPVQRSVALHHLERGFSDRVDALRREILDLEALIAYDIDFPEEDEGPVSPDRVRSAWSVVRDRLADLVKTAPEGERLREGALLVIAGRPNAGKSSLFNALLGSERAIVTEIAGTTRDAIEAPAVIGGYPFRLVDTAGLRDSTERIEQLGIEISKRYLQSADLILFCRDSDADELPETGSTPVVEVVTKADLPDRPEPRRSDGVSVSVISGHGLAELQRKLAIAAFGGLMSSGGQPPVVTRARHRAALERAILELDNFWGARETGIDAAAAATHLRAAATALDELIGVVTPEDILDRVFAAFCVGK
ncbi:MAG TPA: tRNA uridine-5-carboxymethylaminomethyl(34) synthesis GTPase MnmE [Gemmatimonadales bacterium]|nr:tRNA uridine-5-carboxymethylaminomethyl(34) synthesis GTPase MnmE [Gemmatimonadales bacterium]